MFQLEQNIIEQQSLLRIGIFLLLIVLLLFIERLWPRRSVPVASSKKHYQANIFLLIINIIALRICIPLAAFEVALFAKEQGIGLFNMIDLPLWLNLALSIVLFDLLIYLQHVAFHYFKPLWKIHRVHHTDLQFDVTTGVRFHPIEIVLSMLYKILAVLVFGPAALAIILYEILLNAAALFTHSNIRLTGTLDTVLRKLLVTPDMHRVHHSVLQEETDSNYGNIFSFWDKVFHTYRAQPRQGHEQMQVGLQEYREDSRIDWLGLLKLPFRQA